MTLPATTRDRIIDATKMFDVSLRSQSEWSSWQQNENFEYALVWGGAEYPVKQVVSMATEVARSEFSGGNEANRLVRRLGFKIRRLRPGGDPQTDWDILPGEKLKRTELHRRYGGGRQGGIEPSAATPNVFLFSDNKAGAPYGYHFDGWKDGIFHYTGEGQVGDQRWRDGNRAILEHADKGRALRLFSGVRGEIEYVGEFELDPEQTFYMADGQDKEGSIRQLIVFRLVPTDKTSGTSGSSNSPITASVAEVPIENNFVENFLVSTEAQDREATRREQALVSSYRKWLESAGHEVVRLKCLPYSEAQPIYCDLYDRSANMLVEAKGTTARANVRMAIGQLFDYSRFAPVGATRAILLPVRPRPDLEALAGHAGVGCIWQEGDRFESNILPKESD